MPTAICETCMTVVGWRNTRGSRKPETCACGGPMVPATFTADGWVPVADRRGKGHGRKRVNCALCGRGRMAPSDNVRTLSAGFRFTDYQRLRYGDEAVAKIGPDDPLCWAHVEAVRSDPC